MKTLMEGVISFVFSFWLLLLILVFHSLGWTGGYILMAASLFFLVIGYQQVRRWSLRQ